MERLSEGFPQYVKDVTEILFYLRHELTRNL